MAEHCYQSNFKVGVLGGGQLGRMLQQAAIDLDIQLFFLDVNMQAPCAQITPNFTKGALNDFDAVYNFGKDKNVVTIEIEHVNVAALKKLEAEGVKVFPQPHLIELIQDKGLQKEFYVKYDIPTSPFVHYESKAQLEELLKEKPYVQKTRKGGYDGQGVQVLKTATDVEKAFTQDSILEDLVDFETEIAVIVARNEKGDVKTYPVVDMEFSKEANLVEFLYSPTEITTKIQEKATEIALKVITDLKLVGILAVEMFITKTGEVLVNEVAPRPHNSGHQTIEGNRTSQYQQHLRAILNLPLGNTAIIQPSVMVNLLGAPNFKGEVLYEGYDSILELDGVYPHIYGKKETKPFRKMGHITVVNPDLKKAKEVAKKVKDIIIVKTK